MEFLEYLLAFLVLFFILFKPQKEKLAFTLIWVALGIDFALWILATGDGILPAINF